MRKSLAAALGLIGQAVAASGAWGSEPWTPAILADDGAAYLPDFSYAGYHWGEEEPPRPAATIEVTAFGAVPDDGADDTAAILGAVAAAHRSTEPAVVAFPRGASSCGTSSRSSAATSSSAAPAAARTAPSSTSRSR